MAAVVLIVIICSFIIVHHIYKVKDELDEIKEKINEISIYQNRHYEHLYNLLYQIDGCIEAIEDKLKE